MITKIINSTLRFFYPIFKRLLPYDVYAYLAVGAVNTILNILLFAIFYQWVLPFEHITFLSFSIASYTISLLIAFLLTVPTGFWLAKYFVFNTEKHQGANANTQFGKYFLVVAQGLISDYLLLKALIVFTGMHPTIAKIVSTVVVLTVNFLLQKFYTFKKSS